MNVLVINAGSSSLKYQLINMVDQQVLCKGQVERIGIEGSFLKQKGGAEEADIHAEIKNHNDAIQMVLEALTDAKHGVVKSLEEIDAVGHRVLHGGEKFADPVLVDEQVIHDLEAIADLGPLHMPANISGIKACQQAMPVPQVAVFDTGFHQTCRQRHICMGCRTKRMKSIRCAGMDFTAQAIYLYPSALQSCVGRKRAG